MVFEARDTCPQPHPPACAGIRSPKAGFGLEGYVSRNDSGPLNAAELEEHLRLASAWPGCESRWIAFAHHSGAPGSVQSGPGAVTFG